MRFVNPAALAILAAVAGMVGYALWQDRPAPALPIESLTSFQDAAAPLLLPADGEPRHGLHLFPAWQAGEIPTATRFDMPLGSADGALTFDSTDLRAHAGSGVALDGLGGMNTDLGDPVLATADGLVVFAGEPSAERGNTVVLAHRETGGRFLTSVYAHLGQIDVAPDTLVARGQRIGTVGTAAGRYPAHLHFEIRHGNGIDFGSGDGELPPGLLDPAADDLSPSPLGVVLTPGEEPWTGLEIQGAEKLGEILAK